MSIWDTYKPEPPRKFKPSKGDGVSLNEGLARTYVKVAEGLAKKKPEGTSGFCRIYKTYIRCTPRVGGKAAAYLIDDVDNNGVNFESATDASAFYTVLAKAVRDKDKQTMDMVANARAKNGERTAKYKKSKKINK